MKLIFLQIYSILLIYLLNKNFALNIVNQNIMIV